MRRVLLSLLLVCACSAEARAPVPLPPEPVEVRGLSNIQRTMQLLESSTAARPNDVRVLFYGQSITQSAWSRKLEVALRRRYPSARLQIENRALGGFASDLLVKTAETDLYPSYADLVIFHVFGAHDRYEDIVRRLRERTTSELLLQTDHVTKTDDLTEQTDAAQLQPKPSMWSAFMNNAFLPGLVARYQVALCEQREAWKRHLRARAQPASSLLRDDVHLNALGDMLMADYVGRCLTTNATRSPAQDWVQTRRVGTDVVAQDGVLRLEFEGNRVDAQLRAGSAGSITASIDGKAPSAWPELYTFARAHSLHAGKWPPIFTLSSEAPLLRETFVLDVMRVGEGAGERFDFTLRGDKTGPDGAGRSDTRFVSDSRRVVIDPEDWNVRYAFELAEVAVPEHFSIELRVDTHFVDSFAASETARVVTIAQGLPNTRHTLELRGDLADLEAVRSYQPPLGRF